MILDSNAERLAELLQVETQLKAGPTSREDTPLIEKLVEIAHSLDVPTRERRDDTHVFLEEPDKISGATWTQCGGVLYFLSQHEPENRALVAAKVAERIARLAPDHR